MLLPGPHLIGLALQKRLQEAVNIALRNQAIQAQGGESGVAGEKNIPDIADQEYSSFVFLPILFMGLDEPAASRQNRRDSAMLVDLGKSVLDLAESCILASEDFEQHKPQ